MTDLQMTGSYTGSFVDAAGNTVEVSAPPTMTFTVNETAAPPPPPPPPPASNVAQLFAEGMNGGVKAHMFGNNISGLQNIPKQAALAETIGHNLDLINLFVDWGTSPASLIGTRLVQASNNGNAIPVVSWQPETFGESKTAPNFPLMDIIAGKFDSYITSVAQAYKSYGGPAIVRLAHEMNANWYSWGFGEGVAPGNTTAQYVSMWQHVRTLFAEADATNAYFMWNPNVETGKRDLAPWYPGDVFVDIVALDGYNGQAQSNNWRTPEQVFGASLASIANIAPSKPLLIGEVGCNENSASWPTSPLPTASENKAAFITEFVQMLGGVPNAFGFLWSEWSGKQYESTPASQSAMQAALAAYWVSS